ncbi:hypothetical protein WBJ53_17705 [Spirosoma sp. SC4-14]|uniref:hypothetical protein n=1 Tax=Spirosoma sp. SC4-14 TaxID=3128900 RepID=UPI0030D23584
MRTVTHSTCSLLWLISLILGPLAPTTQAQSKNSALDSMGANIGRQNWKAATQWALKAAEADPKEKYWRYLNAADFASRDKNAELAIQYASLVVDSDIATNAYFGKSFDWLRDDPRWKTLMDKVAQARQREHQQRIQASLPFRSYQNELISQANLQLASLSKIASAPQLYKQLQTAPPTHTYSRTGQYQYAWLRLRDSLEFPYLVQLPAHFNATKRYPLVVVLHGAVSRQTALPDVADSTTAFFGRLFMEQAAQSGLIAVFPYSTRQYNWMMPDDGFGLVPELVREVKHMYSIDDSRVYVTGHSNGATGAFSYLMKQPSLFAGFSGLNNRPQVRTGGTFLKNAMNRSFYNVATDYDYYFPLEGHRSLTNLAKTLGVDWQNQEILGHRNHGYLITAKDSTTKEVYRHLFAHMLTKQRNPFQSNLYWECDDVQNGRCDWLEINELDTTRIKASWQSQPNVLVQGWRNVNNASVLLDSTSQAFAFPRQSGAIQGRYSKNQFNLTTSRVGLLTIYLSPEMVDFNRPLKVFINDKQVYNGLVEYDRTFLVSHYRKEMDHQALWVNRLAFRVK